MKRYDKLVLCAEDGMTFMVSNGENGELIIKAMSVEKANSFLYSDQYVNPPIPEGYKHICGEWNNGFTIERISDGSQLVWVPVGWLDSNGTLDGKKFDEKFGRRPFDTNIEFLQECIEYSSDEFALQIASVKKYGGFYVSRYSMSFNKETCKWQSVKGGFPFVKMDSIEFKKLAASFENTENVKSHLLYGSEYDSVLEWFEKTKARSRSEIVEDSSSWGYYDDKNCKEENFYNPKTKLTGHFESCCTNNIYDFTGLVPQVTQEFYSRNGGDYIVRGGGFCNSGKRFYASYRNVFDITHIISGVIGYRVALWIK